jgi:hypothetical protein
MKKILVSLSAVAMLAAMAAPALADNATGCTAPATTQCADRRGSNSISNTSETSTTVITQNQAGVFNGVLTTSNSGGNNIGSAHGDVNNATVNTGASNSNSTVTTVANVTTTSVDTSNTDNEASTPAMPTQSSDRGGSSSVSNGQSNDAAVGTSNSALVGNFVGSTSSTGVNGVGTLHGDVNGAGVNAGVSTGTSKVGTFTNMSSTTVVR